MVVQDSWLAQRVGLPQRTVVRILAELSAENATRVPCSVCGVPILPANLARHEALHQETDA